VYSHHRDRLYLLRLGGTANRTWGDIFESSFKAQSSKLQPLFSLKRGQRDVRILSVDLSNRIRKCHSQWDRLYITLEISMYSLFTSELIHPGGEYRSLTFSTLIKPTSPPMPLTLKREPPLIWRFSRPSPQLTYEPSSFDMTPQ